VPYTLLCTLLGFGLGWLPMLTHGPIPYRFDILGMRGSVAVWAFYSARLLVGFLVGITVWPGQWWLRGPLCGLVMLVPVTIIVLATPGCGFPCMFWNQFSAALVGTVVAGVAWGVTGRHHR
jgi:hypothetical protein